MPSSLLYHLAFCHLWKKQVFTLVLELCFLDVWFLFVLLLLVSEFGIECYIGNNFSPILKSVSLSSSFLWGEPFFVWFYLFFFNFPFFLPQLSGLYLNLVFWKIMVMVFSLSEKLYPSGLGNACWLKLPIIWCYLPRRKSVSSHSYICLFGEMTSR